MIADGTPCAANGALNAVRSVPVGTPVRGAGNAKGYAAAGGISMSIAGTIKIRPPRGQANKAKDNIMKRKFIKLTAVFALAAAPFSGQALAQAVAAAGTSVPFVTEQPANEWLARVFIGQAVHNAAGEVIGDIRDLVFDHSGRITTAVIGVGGYLGMGEKWVGVAFESLTYKSGDKGERVIVAALTKEALVKAPAFVATEKTTMDAAKDKASQWGHATADKAVELKDEAVQKYKDMRKPEEPKQ